MKQNKHQEKAIKEKVGSNKMEKEGNVKKKKTTKAEEDEVCPHCGRAY